MEYIKLGLTHPDELRAIVNYKIWRDPVHDFQKNPEESGWGRERMRDCWAFLDATSRSFAGVIKELRGTLSRVICIFYLVLRALDTIEDDMTLKPEVKIPLLLNFYKKLEEPGWNFTGSGPNEKDRQLLVEFDKVIAEYQLLNDGCRRVISDICARMGAGMASYIEMGNSPTGLTMQTWADYDLYCHFVAGLVGEGLSGLFVQTGIERPLVALQLSLSNHMGLFLQKTNIIRDYAEDCAEGRSFWPKECWGTDGIFKHQSEIQRGVVETKPGSNNFRFDDSVEGAKAKAILSSMLLDAMSHSVNSLEYLFLLKDQSVFNFCATPQIMAIATLAELFDNANVYKKNVKIRKGMAVRMILQATNPREIAQIFLTFARRIHKKLSVADPNYVRWCIVLGRIESWSEGMFPSYVMLKKSKTADVRSAMFQDWVFERERAIRKIVFTEKMKSKPTEEIGLPVEESLSKVFYFNVFTIVIAVVSFMVFIGYVSWMIVWYTIEGRMDPLTMLILNTVRVLRAKEHSFTLSPIYWLNTFYAAIKEAGSIVMADTNARHGIIN